MKMIAFWDTVQCILVEEDKSFVGTYCLHHQGDSSKLHGAIFLKVTIFMCVFLASETCRMLREYRKIIKQ
jgi:hypothetical protein